MTLKGKRELQARLKAIKTTFKPAGRAWAEETVRQARPHIPVREGRLKRSVRVKNASMRRATVAAHYTAYFVDKGPKPHIIKANKARLLRFQVGGQTIFTRQVHHRGYRGRPFREKAAREALRREPMAGHLVKLWNEAA